MEGILETLNEGVIIVDDCEHIVFVNSVFEEMTGYSRDELCRSGRGPSSTSRRFRHLQELRNKTRQAGHNRFEFVLPQKDGRRLPVIISARRLKILTAASSRSSRSPIFPNKRRAEAQLREANSELEERQKKSKKIWRLRRACSKALRRNRSSGAACASKRITIPCARLAATLASSARSTRNI